MARSFSSAGPTAISVVRSSLPRPSSALPTVVAVSRSQSYWTTIEAEVEAHLKSTIPIRPPLIVFEPMHHLAFAATRNLAPSLCVATCELVGGRRSDAVAAAAALHLMLAAGFVHERLLSIDKLRTNSTSTAQREFEQNIELLTGDGMVPFGYELLAASCYENGANAERILRVITEITRVTSSQGMIDGQYEQAQYCKSDDVEVRRAKHKNRMIEKKEGDVHACGAACGAIVGGTEDEIEKLRRFGFYVGKLRGMSSYGVAESNQKMELADELGQLALKQLTGFDKSKIEHLCSLIDACLCYA